MITRRWLSGVLVTALLPVAGCADDKASQEQASASATTLSVTSGATPEQLASRGATAAFEQMLHVKDAASRAPGIKDWESEIRRYTGDPAAFLAVKSVRDLATMGLRQEGDSRVDVKVTTVDLKAPEGPTVRLAGCYDSQSTQIVNAESGQAVPHGTPSRYLWDITV